jgi:ribosome biogenesis protein UTP30
MAEEMLDSHVSIEQAKLAIGALHKHANKVQKDKEEVELLPGREQHIWLVVGTKRVYPEGKLKPFRM